MKKLKLIAAVATFAFFNNFAVDHYITLEGQGDADLKCPSVCGSHGGWTGQWVGWACGCNS